MTNAVLVVGELPYASVDSQVHACIEIAVQVVAHEISMMFDI
jgi:hypothetical protein